MKRKLLFLERILYGDGKAPFNATMGVKIRGRFTLEKLSRALAKVQAMHPMLRVCIREDPSGMPWFVTNEKVPEVPVRILERTSDEDWKKETVAEWRKPFDVKNGPLMRAVWIRSEEVSDLVLSAPHCGFDGMSGLMIMQDVLAFLDHPDKAVEPVTNTFSSIRDLVPASVLSRRKDRLKATLMLVFTRLSAGKTALFMRTRNKRKIPREQDYLIHWKLSKEMSSALLRRCVKARVSTHSALSFALLSAWMKVKGKNAHNKMVCPVDIRSYVKEIKKDMVFSFGLAVNLSLPVAAPGKEPEFWEAVKKMHEDLSGQAEKLDGHKHLMYLEYFHPLVKPAIKIATYKKPNYDLMFSNIGRVGIPKDYDSFEIADIHCPTVIGPYSNPNTILTITFRGQMAFSFISNNEVLDEQDAVAVKDQAMAILQREVALQAVPAS